MLRQPDYGGLEQWPFVYGYRFTVPFNAAGGNFLQYFNALPIQGDADFVVRGMAADTSRLGQADFSGLSPAETNSYLATLKMADDSSLITLQFTEGATINPLPLFGLANNFGQSVAANFIQNEGSAGALIPVLPERRLTKASTMFATIGNVNGAGGPNLVIELALHGFKLQPPGTYYRLSRTQRWKTREHTYSSQIPNPAAGITVPSTIVRIDGDSAFLLYAVWTTSVAVAGSQFQMYGPNGERTSNGLLSTANTIGTSRKPRYFCPPIVYPPAGQIVYDWRLPNPAPAAFVNDQPQFLNFYGVKLYPAT